MSEALKEIAAAVEYIDRYGPAFVDQLRQGNFNVIAATDLKSQAERLARNIGAAALALAQAERSTQGDQP